MVMDLSRFESYPSFSYSSKPTRLLHSSKAVKMMQKETNKQKETWVKKKKRYLSTDSPLYHLLKKVTFK